MAEDRLTFPDFKHGAYNQIEKPTPMHIKPFYYKYGGQEAFQIAMEEGGIGGKWKVAQMCSKSLIRINSYYSKYQYNTI